MEKQNEDSEQPTSQINKQKRVKEDGLVSWSRKCKLESSQKAKVILGTPSFFPFSLLTQAHAHTTENTVR